MLRRSAATVLAGFVLLVLPGILATATSLPAGTDSWLMRITPTAAFAIQTTLPRSSLGNRRLHTSQRLLPDQPLGRPRRARRYTAVAVAAATWLLRRRDA